MHSRLNRWTACSKFVFNSIRFLEWNDKVQDDVKEKCCWKIKRIFKNSKQKFIQTLWSTCLHKLIYLRLMYKIFSQISHLYSFNVFQLNYNENENANPKKNLRSTIKNFIREKEACFKQICKSANEKSRREKREATLPHRIQHVRHRASSITTDSKMASRSTGQSSDHHRITEKEKRGREKK